MRISIIIPVYNVERYVRCCIESVIAQETPLADIECVIIDDCTPDNSMSIVLQMIEAYHGTIHFQIINHDKNRGLSAARNTGLRNATGDYIFFLDSDDRLSPDSIQYFVESASVYPKVDLIMGGPKMSTSDHQQQPLLDPIYFCDRGNYAQYILRRRTWSACNKLIRRSLLIDNHIFFMEGILFEDYPWSYEVSCHVSSALLLPRQTYIYEYNDESITKTILMPGKGDKILNSFVVAISRMLKNPPTSKTFNNNITVDYLLCMAYPLQIGVDILLHSKVNLESKKKFRFIRLRLLKQSLLCGRLLIFAFLLLLFPPFCYLQNFRLFRRNYDRIENIVNRLSHLLDLVHGN